MKFKLFALLAMAVLILAAPAKMETLVFTAVLGAEESQLRTCFDKEEDYLPKSLSVKVKYVLVKSCAATVTASRNNEVQLVWFGALSSVRKGT